MQGNLKVSLSDASIAGEFTIFLFNVRTVTHMLHLNTRSMAQHLALDEFYKSITELADRFAESSIGHFGAITWPETIGDGLVIATDPVVYLRQVKTGGEKAITLTQPEDLLGILDEILELTTKTLYKLTNLE